MYRSAGIFRSSWHLRTLLSAQSSPHLRTGFATRSDVRPQAVALATRNTPATSVSAEPFMNGSSSVYIEQMYENWRQDPGSVHASWDAYFRNVEAGAAPGQAFQVVWLLQAPSRN